METININEYEAMFDAKKADDPDTGVFILWIPVQVAKDLVYDDNPKDHDFGKLIQSIAENGFLDPPKFDLALNGIVEGNGRIQALSMMEYDHNYAPPRGIWVDGETWRLPILFGVDARTKADALKYLIDHNNLVMTGGSLSALDMSRVWEPEQYLNMLEELNAKDSMPKSVDRDDLALLLEQYNEDLEQDISEGEIDDQIDLDEDDYREITVYVGNITLAPDVLMQIQELIDDNPGWDAAVIMEIDL